MWLGITNQYKSKYEYKYKNKYFMVVMMKVNVRIDRIPVFLTQFDKWYVATSPQPDLVAKGRTVEEAKENISDLLDEYFKDPYTIKPNPEAVLEVVFIPVKIPQGVSHKTSLTA